MVFETLMLEIESLGDIKIIINNVEKSQGKWIIYLHGLPGGPIDQLSDSLIMFEKVGLSSISFNYPGLWRSPGKFNLEDIRKVLKSIFAYIDALAPKKVFIFGESFGGLVAFNTVALKLYKIDKIVLRSPLTDVRPIIHFLPDTLGYLKMAGVLHSDPEVVLKDLSKVNPPNLFYNTKQVQFWGVIGKDDEVLPGKEMVAVTEGFENITLELWDNFPHNLIPEHLWNLFLKKMSKFLNP